MKNILFYIILIAVAAGIYFFNNPRVDFAADKKEGIQFYRGSWDSVMQLAKKENKLIFLDVYATWCGPCKKLKKYTFADKEAGEYFNKHFINVSLDGEQGDGDVVSRRYGVTSYPSLLFIDADGNKLSLSSGYRSSKKLIEYAQTLLK